MSDQTTVFTFECPKCHGLLELPSAAALTGELQCSYCAHVIRPPSPKSSARKVIVLIAVLIGMAAVGVGLALGLKRFARVNPNPEFPVPQVASLSTNGFTISGLTIENQGSLRYATGTASNELGRQRFGARIQLELLDTNDFRVGTASDYRSVLTSNEVWLFRALIVEPRAASAALLLIREDQ